MTAEEMRERCLAIVDEMANAHAEMQGTVVAGAYSEYELAAVHVNIMAKAHDIAEAIRKISIET